MYLGFIGFGEAAYKIAQGLNESGMKNIVAFDIQFDHPIYGKLIRERAENSQVKLVESSQEVLETAKILIIAVPVNKNYEVYQSLKNNLQMDTIYFDLTASRPEEKEEIAKQLTKINVHYVDGAIMGPVVVYGHKVPILVSGEKADQIINDLTPFGMNIESVGSTVGSASAIKLIRSIFMKGVSALLFEMLEAANKFNVADSVIQSIGKTLDETSFADTLNRLVTGTAIHSERRSKELEGSIKMLKSLNLEATMTEAAQAKLEAISNGQIKEAFCGKAPDSWVAVIKLLEKMKN